MFEKAKELRVGDRVKLSKEWETVLGRLSHLTFEIIDINERRKTAVIKTCEDLPQFETVKYSWLEKVTEENKEWCKRCGAGDPFTMFPNDACYRCGAGVEYATDVKPEEADKK